MRASERASKMQIFVKTLTVSAGGGRGSGARARLGGWGVGRRAFDFGCSVLRACVRNARARARGAPAPTVFLCGLSLSRCARVLPAARARRCGARVGIGALCHVSGAVRSAVRRHVSDARAP